MVICLAPSVYADDDAVLIPLRAADRSSSSSSHHTAHQRRQKLSTEDLLWQRTALLPLELAPDENCIVCKGSQSTTDWGGKKRTQNSSKAILYYIQHGHICLPSAWGHCYAFEVLCQISSEQRINVHLLCLPIADGSLGDIEFSSPSLSFLCARLHLKYRKFEKGAIVKNRAPYYIIWIRQ